MKRLVLLAIALLALLLLLVVACAGESAPAAPQAPPPAASAPAAPQAPAPAPAPAWKPTRPIIFLVGFGPGGGHDLFARIVGPVLQEQWGVPVVVKNLPGADEFIMRSELKKSKPDGHTFGITFMNNAIGHEALGVLRVPYGSIEEFTHLGRLTTSDDTYVVGVHRKAKTIEDLKNVELIIDKSSPTAIKEFIVGKTFGFPKQFVPKSLTSTGSVDQFNQIVRGERDVFASDVTTATLVGIVQAQRNPVPIFHFGQQRHRLAKEDPIFNVPTVVELGHPELLAMNSYRALIGPPNMPPEAVQGIRDAFGKALQRSDVQEKLGRLGLQVGWLYGAEWDKLRKDLKDLLLKNKDEYLKLIAG